MLMITGSGEGFYAGEYTSWSWEDEEWFERSKRSTTSVG